MPDERWSSVTQRRRPRPSELKEILRPKPIVLNPTDRRLAGAHTIADLRMLARKRTPRAAFDYTDGAAELEDSLRRARQAYRRVEFRPNVLRGVSDVDTSREILGKRAALPLAFAPTGFTRMMQTEGELAVGRVAQRNGLPMGLSTMATTSIEDLAAAAPDARKWFQLSVWHDRGAGEDLMNRAWEHGYDTLLLTVDTPVAGARLRDVRNGLTIPPALTLKTFADAARTAARGAGRGPGQRRSMARHRHPLRRGHRGRPGPRRAHGADRPRVPVRPDGRRRARRAALCRHPAHGDDPHDAAARGSPGGRPAAYPRDTSLTLSPASGCLVEGRRSLRVRPVRSRTARFSRRGP
jgi:hypothetical protein